VQTNSRTWAAVGAVALGAFVIVTSEFIPVGFLPRIAGSLHVSLGTAGLMVLTPGLSAAIAAPLIFVRSGRIDRRKVIAGLGALVVLSNAVAAVAPTFALVLAGRVLLGVAIAGFWTVVTPVGPKLAGPRHGTRATAVIATAIAFVGQFAASTFITPLLTERAGMGDGTVTGLFLAYGAGGIVGTLAGGPLVARSRVGTYAVATAGVGLALLALPGFGTDRFAVGAAVVAWGLIWGLIPLAAQVWMLHAMPGAEEAASAVNVSNMQISIAVGSAVGGLLVDHAGLAPVYRVAGVIVLAAALFASIAGRRTRPVNHTRMELAR